MTFRMSLIAAVLLFSASGARASTAPTSTDQARALAAQATLIAVAAPAVTATRHPMSTDEARVLAGRSLPSTTSLPALALSGYPRTTDEARALGASGNQVVAASSGQKAAQVVAQACTCHHG